MHCPETVENRPAYKNGRGVRKTRSEEVFSRIVKTRKKAQLLWSWPLRLFSPIPAREFCASKVTFPAELTVTFTDFIAKRTPLLVTFGNIWRQVVNLNEDYQGIIDDLYARNDRSQLFSAFLDIPNNKGFAHF